MLELLQALPISDLIRRSTWLFPAIEVLHLAGIAMVLGTVTVVDLALLGILRSPALATAVTPLLAVTKCGIAIAALSGALLFVSDPLEFWNNPAFRLKLLAFSLAIANALLFQRFTRGSAEITALGPIKTLSISASLLLWCSVLVLGRAIAYV
ncbi:hypothetical protein KHC28_17180 [Ancylobacter sonchi]|uniref:hypothetical protein n=1 Tax=Ancylobacter sonchi TaxID=1937790 RepID=UPI001BD4FACA|nr:hypothetical protein [Ancylobacter sonchi]MBS7535390.1 hypothetical protein [Ancylobacter sonchi]